MRSGAGGWRGFLSTRCCPALRAAVFIICECCHDAGYAWNGFTPPLGWADTSAYLTLPVRDVRSKVEGCGRGWCDGAAESKSLRL